MRGENYARAMLGCVIDRGNRGADARVVFYTAVFDGNVEIDANKDALAFELKIANGKFRHFRFLKWSLTLDFRGLSSCDFVDRLTAMLRNDPRNHTK